MPINRVVTLDVQPQRAPLNGGREPNRFVEFLGSNGDFVDEAQTTGTYRGSNGLIRRLT
jgi:hypothetical protein